jgi:hypothetical protein
MNNDLDIQAILKACDTLARRVITIEGGYHGSTFLFDQCMRAFDAKLPAEAVTFSVFINTPVMLPGSATIHRDGKLEMHTTAGA